MKGGAARAAIQALRQQGAGSASSLAAQAGPGAAPASAPPPALALAASAEQQHGAIGTYQRGLQHVTPLVVRQSPPLRAATAAAAAAAAVAAAHGPAATLRPASTAAVAAAAAVAAPAPLVLELNQGGVTLRLSGQQQLIINSGSAGRRAGPMPTWLLGFVAGGTCSAAVTAALFYSSGSAPPAPAPGGDGGAPPRPFARVQQASLAPEGLAALLGDYQQQPSQQPAEQRQDRGNGWLQPASLLAWGSAKAAGPRQSGGEGGGGGSGGGGGWENGGGGSSKAGGSHGGAAPSTGQSGAGATRALPTPWLEPERPRGPPPPAPAAEPLTGGLTAALGALSSSAGTLLPIGGGGGGGGGGDGGAAPADPKQRALLRSSISQAAAAVAPAVVHLVMSDPGAAPPPAAAGAARAAQQLPGAVDGRPASSTGSGFLYDVSGRHAHILTNAHVVAPTPGAGGPGALLARPAVAAGGAAGGGAAPTSAPIAGGGTGGGGWFRRLTGGRTAAAAEAPAAWPIAPASTAPQPGAGAAAAAPYRQQQAVTVHMSDGRVFEGRVVALDRPSDLAVVRIELSGGEGDAALVPARLGSSAGLQVGEWVCALGSPLMLRRTVTAGIVSALERSSSELGISTPRQAFVQTDAPVNLGSSGGPLVNLDGEVVGILSMKALAADGVSFCIPIDTAKEVVEELGRHGRVRRPRIGAAIAEVSPARMSQLKASCPDFPASVPRGLVVTGVQRGGAAAAGGLRADDVIVGWDGYVGGGGGGGGAASANGSGSGGGAGEGDGAGAGNGGGGGGGTGGADMIAAFASALKRHLGGPPLALSVVRQAADGGYAFERIEVQPSEAES